MRVCQCYWFWHRTNSICQWFFGVCLYVTYLSPEFSSCYPLLVGLFFPFTLELSFVVLSDSCVIFYMNICLYSTSIPGDFVGQKKMVLGSLSLRFQMVVQTKIPEKNLCLLVYQKLLEGVFCLQRLMDLGEVQYPGEIGILRDQELITFSLASKSSGTSLPCPVLCLN